MSTVSTSLVVADGPLRQSDRGYRHVGDLEGGQLCTTVALPSTPVAGLLGLVPPGTSTEYLAVSDCPLRLPVGRSSTSDVTKSVSPCTVGDLPRNFVSTDSGSGS